MIRGTRVGLISTTPRTLCSRCGILINAKKSSVKVCRDCMESDLPIGKKTLAKIRQWESEHPEAAAAFNAGLVA